MNHLKDDQIQSYLDKNKSENIIEIKNHLKNCETCRLNLSAYQKIYGVIENESIPELSHDFLQSTINKLDNSDDKKWSIIENITVAFMFVVSLLISIYFLDYLNVLSFFKAIDFSFIIGLGKKIINALSPNFTYLIAALLITIAVELLDRFKIQKSFKHLNH